MIIFQIEYQSTSFEYSNYSFETMWKNNKTQDDVESFIKKNIILDNNVMFYEK
jgi:hypothetical protein